MSNDPKYVLCPYCGNIQSHPTDRCRACAGFFDPLSVKVTHQMMGPWYIRDRNMPFRPGANYDVILKQAERGRIKPNTIVRGPTTRQLWSLARHVPGIAHKLGYCHGCGSGEVGPNADECPECHVEFPTPLDSDSLGLGPKAIAFGQPRSSLEITHDQSAEVAGEQVTVHQPGRAMGDAPDRDVLEPVRGVHPPKSSPDSQTFRPPAGPPTPTPAANRDDALNWLTGANDGDAFATDHTNPNDRTSPSRMWLLWTLIIFVNLILVAAVVFILTMNNSAI